MCDYLEDRTLEVRVLRENYLEIKGFQMRPQEYTGSLAST